MSDVPLPVFETEAPKLEHLGKLRPKRVKTRAVSKGGIPIGQSSEDITEVVDSGVQEFFERKEVLKEYVEVKGEDKNKEKGDEEKRDDG